MPAVSPSTSPGAFSSPIDTPPAVYETPTPEAYATPYNIFSSQAAQGGKVYEAHQANADVIGWLTIPNTNIDYPVVMAKDNTYYLTNSAEKKPSKAGAIFMDCRNADAYEQHHLIIYCHNMRDGSMFHDLRNYKLEDFFNNNRLIELTIGDTEMAFEVYAAFVVEVDKVGFTTTHFGSAEDFAQYMNQLAALSKFSTGVTIMPSDQVLTLSTCTYELENARYIVQARKK
jgi:sortase B